MANHELMIECLSNSLEGIGIKLTGEQLAVMATDVIDHIDSESDIFGSDGMGAVSHKEECRKCVGLQYDLNLANKQIEAYQQNVKNRRNADEVGVTSAGEVWYK